MKYLNADAINLLTMNNDSGRNISPVIFDQTNNENIAKLWAEADVWTGPSKMKLVKVEKNVICNVREVISQVYNCRHG